MNTILPHNPDNSPLTRALAQGVPLFLDADIAKASPGNASPYLIDNGDFTALFSGSERRADLIAALRERINSMQPHFIVHAIMIGGSMLDLSEASPHDLDAVVFYALNTAEASADTARYLAGLMHAAKEDDLDLRFVPTDSEPHILIRAACFFAALYSSRRELVDPRKGALLLAGGTL